MNFKICWLNNVIILNWLVLVKVSQKRSLSHLIISLFWDNYLLLTNSLSYLRKISLFELVSRYILAILFWYQRCINTFGSFVSQDILESCDNRTRYSGCPWWRHSYFWDILICNLLCVAVFCKPSKPLCHYLVLLIASVSGF